MKLAIVGTGQIAEEVLPRLGGWGWTARALCGTPRSEEKVRKLAAAYDIPLARTDYSAMLRETDADAVSTLHLPAYQKVREWLPRVGTVKLVSCNFSQYSSRYDAFRAGGLPSVFDPARSGGALMDLNLYNLHFLIGLFGRPEKASYHPNLERGIDTSGVLLLDYGSFRAVSLAAKDSVAPALYTIQGTDGCISLETPANGFEGAVLRLRDGAEERFRAEHTSRLEPEFRFFAREIASGDRTKCRAQLEHSVLVSRVLTEARLGAGIRFPSDSPE